MITISPMWFKNQSRQWILLDEKILKLSLKRKNKHFYTLQIRNSHCNYSSSFGLDTVLAFLLMNTIDISLFVLQLLDWQVH